MNLHLSEEQTLIQDTLAKVFKEHSTGARIRAAEPVGFDAALWRLVWELGVPLLRAPEEHGGAGAGLMHAVVAAHEGGRHLASIPLVEALVVHRLLAALGAEGKALLDRCVQEQLVTTLALQDGAQHRRQVVPAGAVARAVLCLADDAVFAVSGFNAAHAPNLGSLPLQRIDVATAPQRRELARGADARRAFLRAIDEWRLLNAAWLAAAARQALDVAAAYACERMAFGRPIGGYQGLAHPLADAVTEVDGARLLVLRAVDAITKGEADAAARVPLAFWWAGEASRAAVLKAMRVYGGYGMSMEYDAQLYYRRVVATSLLAGDPDAALQLGADRLWADAEAAPLEAGDVGIDFGFDAKAQAAAAQARRFCERHHGQAMERFQYESEDGHQPAVWRDMAAERLLYPELPRDWQGGGHGPLESLAIAETIGEFGWYMPPVGVSKITASMILHFGTDAARAEILPRIARGEAFCALGYTEPSGGSDVFAARTTAVRDGDDWLINGQKMFTSQGHFADHCLMLVRTGPDKYAGLTLFVVPIPQPGYRVSEVKTIGDDRTNITFYDDVRVPDRYRLGDVGGGVKVMAAALTLEQSNGNFFVAEMKQLLKNALAWARGADVGEPPALADAAVRRVLAELKTRLDVQEALSRRCAWAVSVGEPHKSYGPMAKLFGSESWLACAERLVRLAAPAALLKGFNPLGDIERRSRRAIPGTIWAGTSEIQRSLIAESALGLPRTRS